jgi:hypothetical protein
MHRQGIASAADRITITTGGMQGLEAGVEASAVCARRTYRDCRESVEVWADDVERQVDPR